MKFPVSAYSVNGNKRKYNHDDMKIWSMHQRQTCTKVQQKLKTRFR